MGKMIGRVAVGAMLVAAAAGAAYAAGPTPAMVDLGVSAATAALPAEAARAVDAAAVTTIYNAMAGWQSIDTAPKDALILLGRFRDGAFITGLGLWVVMDDLPTRPGAWSVEEWFDGIPTHWAPVPADPAP